MTLVEHVQECLESAATDRDFEVREYPDEEGTVIVVYPYKPWPYGAMAGYAALYTTKNIEENRIGVLDDLAEWVDRIVAQEVFLSKV